MPTDFENIDIERVKIVKVKNYYTITYNDKPIIINTPVVVLPFGLEKEYSNYILKLQLRNIKINKELEDLYNFFTKLENRIQNYFRNDNGLFKSQIRLHKTYDPLLLTKIPQVNNKFLCEYTEMNKKPLNMFNIEKGEKVVVKLLIDTIWIYKNTVSYKIKVKKIVCVK